MKATLLKLLLATLSLLSVSANAATYAVTSTGNYTGKTDFTACVVGTCTNYTLAMNVSGTFTTPTLAANLAGSNIAPAITAFSFSDGINTYASTDPTIRLYQITVTTNASGTLTSASILVEKWLSGASPHAVNDLFSYLSINGANAIAYNNNRCGGVGASPATGVADSCQNDSAGTQRSVATGATVAYGMAAAPATAVPTLSQWSMLLLAGLIALTAVWQLRRQQWG